MSIFVIRNLVWLPGRRHFCTHACIHDSGSGGGSSGSQRGNACCTEIHSTAPWAHTQPAHISRSSGSRRSRCGPFRATRLGLYP